MLLLFFFLIIFNQRDAKKKNFIFAGSTKNFKQQIIKSVDRCFARTQFVRVEIINTSRIMYAQTNFQAKGISRKKSFSLLMPKFPNSLHLKTLTLKNHTEAAFAKTAVIPGAKLATSFLKLLYK